MTSDSTAYFIRRAVAWGEIFAIQSFYDPEPQGVYRLSSGHATPRKPSGKDRTAVKAARKQRRKGSAK